MQIFFIHFAVNISKLSNMICLRDFFLKLSLHMGRYWAQSVPGLDTFTMKTPSQICADSVWVWKGKIQKNSRNIFSKLSPNLFRQGLSIDKDWPFTSLRSLSMVLADSLALFFDEWTSFRGLCILWCSHIVHPSGQSECEIRQSHR